MVRIWIDNMKFNDDTSISLNKNDIVVFVGPNNAGKSATLKEAALLMFSFTHKHKVLKSIEIESVGSKVELTDFLSDISRSEISASDINYIGDNFNVGKKNSEYWWENYKTGLNNLTPIFVKSLSTEDRLEVVNPPKNIKLTSENFSHPIHYLQADDRLEFLFSKYFFQAFGLDLIVHRNAGNEVPLYVGKRPIATNGEDRVSKSYVEKIEKLDLLHRQGDGMRSFVGVLLKAFISKHSILLIDEPEAFLHPPQARLLGKMLVDQIPTDRQLFLATHSEDLLKGLLETNVLNLKIVRIRREGVLNKVSVLESSDINSIWSDSLLRHSNILSGLFHDKVVICEGDSDCRFYSAVLSSIFDKTGNIVPDVLFLSCGGKQRLPTVINALRKLNVPLKVVADFDLLNDINPLKDIYEDLHGVWADIETDWKLVKSEIEQKRPEFLTEDVKNEIQKILQFSTSRIFPSESSKEILRVLRKASAWSEAKSIGKAYLPSGDATLAFDRLQLKFKQIGLLLVEVGQLESFAKSVGNHGPKWVFDVLNKDLKTDPELELARNFVMEIIS